MKVAEVDVDESTFRPFTIQMTVESWQEFEALRVAAAHMPDGTGLKLYDLLEEKKRGL
jgi:hypothetical protein